MNGLRKRWPALRACVLTLLVVHCVLYGLPIAELTEERLSRPSWQGWVSAVEGVTGDTPEASRVRIHEVSVAALHVQDALTRPFAWAYRSLEAGQKWIMFNVAAQMSFQLYVDMSTGEDSWRTLYTVHDDEAAFEAERLEYRRVRATYDAFSNGTPGPYYAFCRWVSKRVFYTFPEATEVRVRMRRLDFRPAEERAAHPERSVWGNGFRLTRAQFEADMRARHE